MKEYKVETIGLVFKTKKRFKTVFQEMIDDYLSKGYTLNSFSMHYEFCTAVFERDIQIEREQ